MASNMINAQMFWPYVVTIPNSVVTMPGDLKESESCEDTKTNPPCDFCEGKTTGSTYDMGTQGKRWNICSATLCWQAAYSQKDRVYNGLVDCLQTRKDVLRWTEEKNKKR